MKLNKLTLAVSSALMIGAPGIMAQQLEEVIVTATRRAESLQDVPVSVTAISGETMDEVGIWDMAELSAYVPNLEVVDASILPNLYMRGIGSGTTHSIEQSVGRFIDDVYIGRAAINLHGLMDVAGVEVLRGPQGTLFGKNTLGGAMIIRTGDPTETFEGRVRLSQSSFSTTGGQTTIDGFVSGPLSDNLSGRIAFQVKDRDGYIENIGPGPDGGTREDIGIRAKLLWDISDRTTATLKLEHMEYEEDGQTSTVIVSRGGSTDAGALGFYTQYVPEFQFARDWISYTDCETTILDPINNTPFCAGREQDSQNITLNIEHDMGSGTLTSITGYQKYWYDHLFGAIDQGAFGGSLRAQRVEELSSFSQEIRFASDPSDNFDYITGIYVEDSDLARDQLSHFNVADPFGFPGRSPMFFDGNYNSNVRFGPPHASDIEDWWQDTQTVAIFGQFRYSFSDSLELTVGGRWATEDKSFEFVTASSPLNTDPRAVTELNQDPVVAQTVYELRADSRSESKFTPAVTLRYSPTDNASYYGTISVGHKTGGFSDRDQEELGFGPETATNYELGMKGVWAGGSLETNLALFYMDIEDLQVARSLPDVGAGFEVKNAAEATSQGIEFDGRWLMTNSLTLSFNMAFLDTEYNDFPGAAETCPEIGGTLETTGAVTLCNYAGLPLIFAPEFKGGISINYFADGAISNWSLGARVGIQYSDKYYGELNYFEPVAQESFSTVDASLTFASPDDQKTVRLIGRNLTEEWINSWGVRSGGTDWTSPRIPREIAVQFTYDF